jgi:putative DNA primase/helicase
MDNYQIGIKALKRLKHVIKDFPFASDVDRTVALAAMVLAIQRPTLSTAPLIGFSATTPASGKTLLMSGIASLMTGKNPAVHGYKNNEDENSKVLMAVLMQCEPLLIDNVKLGMVLEGECLCAVLSSPSYAGRELGYSKIKHVSTRILIFATGNNLRIGNDLTRRTLMCHLDAKVERPELRVFDRNFLEICSW